MLGRWLTALLLLHPHQAVVCGATLQPLGDLLAEAELLPPPDGMVYQLPVEALAAPQPRRLPAPEARPLASDLSSKEAAYAFPPAATSDTAFGPLVRLDRLPAGCRGMSLLEAIHAAMSDRTVLRSLSASFVGNPAGIATALDPEIQASDANFGVEAAWSQFDPNFTASTSYAKNDDYFNNPTTTGNAAEVKQDFTSLAYGLSRTVTSGAQFSIDHLTTHDNNNNTRVIFPHAWESAWEMSVRQPLLQGRGKDFNLIAGPNSRPGFLGTAGVTIAKTNNRIAQAAFERGLIDYLLEIIDAYWQLELAYRNYETVGSTTSAAYENWQIALARYNNGLPGGEADREAQARSQYYQLAQELDRTLNSQQSNGLPGVLQAEANLRRLLNLPLSDGQLIRPSDSPTDTVDHFDWCTLASNAIGKRVELKQQRTRLRQAELTVVAARNFTLPRVDAVATYRLSGLGDDLMNRNGKFGGALNELSETNYEEWEFGLNYDVPLGRRRARAGLRNAKLKAAREQAILDEMESQVLHELASVYRTLEQSENDIRLSKLRRDAARDTYEARGAAYNADSVGFEDLLEAQRFYLDSELALHRSLTRAEQAKFRLYSEAGALLESFAITPLSE